MAREYREVREVYIASRTSTLVRGPDPILTRREAKAQACQEFNELVQQQRTQAVAIALARERET